MGKRPSLHQPAPSEGAASGELSERSTGTLVCAISSLMSEVSVPEALTTPPPPSLPSAPPSPPKPRCLVEGAEPGPSAFSMILCSLPIGPVHFAPPPEAELLFTSGQGHVAKGAGAPLGEEVNPRAVFTAAAVSTVFSSILSSLRSHVPTRPPMPLEPRPPTPLEPCPPVSLHVAAGRPLSALLQARRPVLKCSPRSRLPGLCALKGFLHLSHFSVTLIATNVIVVTCV
ncbi:unnamed protein product, partial [Rangifer tarandus platyrhynchus]